jgi:hypothetical protein
MKIKQGQEVKFTIEIYATSADGSESLLHRTVVSTITPLGARKKASILLSVWQRRGAKIARVLNSKSDTIYKIAE